MAEAVADRVRAIIAEQLGVKLEEVTDTASFIEDLGADSLDTVELVMALEEEFGIEIPDEDAEKMAPSATPSNTSSRRPPARSSLAVNSSRDHRTSALKRTFVFFEPHEM